MGTIKRALGLTEAISIKRQTILVAIFFALFFFLAILQPALGMSFNAWVDGDGVLHVNVYGNVKITCEDGYVKINGQDPSTGGPVPCTDINGIVVNGNEGDNKIDLGDVGPENFPNVENVVINGGDGNDDITGSGFGDEIDGGAGRDGISGGAGDDNIDGGAGGDNIVGDDGDDNIVGGEGDDILMGDDGDDKLNGGDGEDNLYGGAGDDGITGGAGNDKLDGGDGNDVVDGGDGNDDVDGGDGNDDVDGGAGNDDVDGGAGNDDVDGGAGDDHLNGGAGNDDVRGGAGNDWLFGGAGNDELFGDAGNDIIKQEPGSADTITDEAGNDTLDFSPATAEITIDLDLQNVDQVVDAAANTVRLEGQFENFVGSEFDDEVFVYPLAVPRNMDGGPHEGDTLNFDAQGAAVTDDGTTIIAEGYAPVTYANFETVNISNTTECLPSIEVNKMVFNETSGEWVDETTAKVNDTLRFRCVVHNNGTCCNLTDITVTDILSDSLEYRDNATVDGVAAEPTAVSENEYKWEFAGPLAPCEAITIEFDARVIECGNDRNTQNATAWCEETGTWVYDEDTVWVNCTLPGTPVETATGSGTAYFATDKGTIEGLAAVNEATLPAEGKPALEFPHGFFSFNITGLASGQTVVVTITLPDNVPVGTEYWKYHASEGGWIQIPMGSDDGDAVITITLVDGGLGDDDGTANGVIVDQGGPGIIPKPDLVIEEIWTKERRDRCKVYFVVKNIGCVPAPKNHYATLLVNDQPVEEKRVRRALRHGEQYESSFRIRVSCTDDVIRVCADNFNDVDESDETNNCWPPIVEKPDLVIENKREEWVDGGYIVHYVIHNKGPVKAPGGHQTTLYVDNKEIEHKEVPVDLEYCQTYTDTFDTVIQCTGGSDIIRVCADNDRIIDEINEDNNCLQNEWSCEVVEKPDLVITDIWTRERRDRCRVYFVVENIGTATALKGHKATLFVNGIPVEEGRAVRKALGPGEEYKSSFRTRIRCAGDVIKVCADNLDVVDESDETNNCREV